MQLRPMSLTDADKMLEWKNYPETRRFAIASHDEIKKEDHLKWLAENIQYFQVFQAKGEDEICGAIRLKNGEISIWVDSLNWKQGRATCVLQIVARRGMTAKIVEGNIGSMKAFIRAGFTPIHYVNASTCNYYIFQKY